MLDKETLAQLVLEGIPYNRHFAMALNTVQPEQVEITLQDRPEYANHVGTVHAAAQYSLAETSSGAMIGAVFADLLGQGVIFLASQATVKYKKGAMGDIRAKASLAQAEQDRVRQELTEGSRANVFVQVALLDTQENVVSEMEFKWVLLKS